jgi:hypothetical protein
VLNATIVAATSLVLGLACLLSTGAARPERRNLGVIVSWLLIALTPVFLVFTYFPQSRAAGQLRSFTITGAFAAFIFIWVYGTRLSLKSMRIQDVSRDLEMERLKVHALQSRLEAHADPTSMVLPDQRVYAYKLARNKRRTIGIVTGNILDVHFVDYWVNSENTNMQMSRFYESTISAAIRYNGALRDDKGAIVEDVIADELKRVMNGSVSVEPGTVLVTEPGQLAHTHNVKAVLHVASVSGQPGAGYQRVHDIGRCVLNVLDTAERMANSRGGSSVIFPLLGTGHGQAGLEPTCKLLVSAVINWFSHGQPRRISQVYFLAYRDADLHVCRKTISETGELVEQGA